jgi:superfamily I DNA/RNA helicase
LKTLNIKKSHIPEAISFAERSGKGLSYWDAHNTVKGEVMKIIHRHYKSFLEHSNSIDFDGLLVHGFQLLSKQEELRWQCQHILVDEL